MCTIYGYARVSSSSQENNTSLKTQIIRLLRSGVGTEQIFIDVKTGKTLQRSALQDLLEKVKPGDIVRVV